MTIRINTDRAREVGQRLIADGNRLAEIERELQNAISNLDTWAWDGISRMRAEPLLSQVQSTGTQASQGLDDLGRKLVHTADVFEQEDATAAQNIVGMSWVVFVSQGKTLYQLEGMPLGMFSQNLEKLTTILKEKFPNLTTEELNQLISAILLHKAYPRGGYNHFIGDPLQSLGLDSDTLNKIENLCESLKIEQIAVGGATINMAHVFAGLAAYYNPTPNDWLGKGAELAGGFNNLEACTYIGDLGGVVSSLELGTYDNVQAAFNDGMINKGDLDGDVDAFAIVKMLQDNPDKTLPEAINEYYTTENQYRMQRYTLFRDHLLNGNPIETIKPSIVDKTSKFAASLQIPGDQLNISGGIDRLREGGGQIGSGIAQTGGGLVETVGGFAQTGFGIGETVDGIGQALRDPAKGIDTTLNGIGHTLQGIGKTGDGIGETLGGIGRTGEGVVTSIEGIGKTGDGIAASIEDVARVSVAPGGKFSEYSDQVVEEFLKTVNERAEQERLFMLFPNEPGYQDPNQNYA